MFRLLNRTFGLLTLVIGVVALIAVLISTYLIEKSKKNKITDKLS